MRTKLLSYLVFAAATVAWMGVGYFAHIVLGERDAYTSRVGTIDQAAQMQAASLRMHALVQDSVDERAKIEKLANVPLLSAVNAIESVGKITGGKLQISDASPARDVRRDKGLVLHAVTFLVQSEGSFSTLVKTLELLESLPLPIAIDGLDIARPPLGTAFWGLSGGVAVAGGRDAACAEPVALVSRRLSR